MERVGRAERLLPYACLAAAAVLFASELMTMFEFTPPGREPLDSQSAAERHGNAMFVVAVFAIAATLVTVWMASKPAAIGVCTMGVIALLVFLLVDLPDAGSIGTLDTANQSYPDAEAVPQAGFWLEMVGALALAIAGAALATMSTAQLAALRPDRHRQAESAPDPPVRLANPGPDQEREAAKSKSG